MPKLSIHVVNSTFTSNDDGAEYPTAEDAMGVGIRSALKIIADEVDAGSRSAAVDVCVRAEDDTAVLRSIVAVSVAPLLISA